MIYVIGKMWQGGKFEAIEAHRCEENARLAAGNYISITGEPFNIVIFTVKLMIAPMPSLSPLLKQSIPKDLIK